MEIVKATAKDVKALCKLVNSAYRGDESKKGWTTEADLLDGIRINEETLKTYLLDNKAEILLAKKHDSLVGCVYLKDQHPSLYLGMLSVDPGQQAKGTGKILLKAAEEKAKSWGCNKINMTVISVREELIKWYKKYGYKETGETEPFEDGDKFGIPKTPLTFIVLEKEIS